MTLRAFALSFAITGVPIGAVADGHQPGVDELFEVLRLPQVMDVMHEEGIEYGATIAQDMFPGRSLDRWSNTVATIYDLNWMETQLKQGLQQELEGDDIASMIAFFSSEPGQTIIELEVAARRSLLDDAVEEAAKEVAALEAADETARHLQIDAFVEANDLVETNIVGALNANFAFFTGLQDGGAFSSELTEEQILTNVWEQEPEIRQSTTEWVYTFLTLAYEPLEDADLDTYIAFSETDPGQQMNAALFVAFDTLFETISRNLGLASAQFMAQQEL